MRRPFNNISDNIRSILWAIFFSIIVVGLVNILFSDDDTEQKQKFMPIPLPSLSHHQSISPSSSSDWQTVTVESTDNLISIASRLGIPYNILQKILNIPKAHQVLSRLHPGQTLEFQFDNTNQLTALRYAYNAQNTLLLTNHDQEWIAQISSMPLVNRLTYKSATIQSSSSETIINHKLSRQLGLIFQGVVNFSRDLQPGDRITILYEQYYANQKVHHTGNILLATLSHHNKIYQAVRYTNSTGHTGYYTPQGAALHPLFLSSPVKYTRISDRFSLNRWHPILHIFRPHLGVDYAAPTGTPVRAVGSGRITFSGSSRGYGKAVIIRHNQKYKTLYAHMQRIDSKLQKGRWIQQGQVIGYVGNSGLATGHHLHFGLYEYGTARNPLLLLSHLSGNPISDQEMSEFLIKTNRLLSQVAYFENHNTLNG